MLINRQIVSFRKLIYSYFSEKGRILPWRETQNPYYILVSEIMLQQTQVERALEKYPFFIETFPDFHKLAQAELKDVLNVWQGLGYNRRALMLKRLAEAIIREHEGALPMDEEQLQQLPGIGKATAGAILAFAFNIPSVFIETNIRRVFIYQFFENNTAVKDDEIFPLIEQTLDRQAPRMWYYALMDYGSMLKKRIRNPNRRSAHYQKQSPFEHSDRKIRGEILRYLLKKPSIPGDEIHASVKSDPVRAQKILFQLVKEGLIKEEAGSYLIS